MSRLFHSFSLNYTFFYGWKNALSRLHCHFIYSRIIFVYVIFISPKVLTQLNFYKTHFVSHNFVTFVQQSRLYNILSCSDEYFLKQHRILRALINYLYLIYLFDAAMSGIDYLHLKANFSLLYHFCYSSWKVKALTVRPRGSPLILIKR